MSQTSAGPYHKHKRKNICEKPENRAKRSEGRTSSILVCAHCNLEIRRIILERNNN